MEGLFLCVTHAADPIITLNYSIHSIHSIHSIRTSLNPNNKTYSSGQETSSPHYSIALYMFENATAQTA